jgi:type III secretory pathway component EscU
VTVINNLLSGGTTIQFILKALSVLFVAVIIFGYYLDDVRRETPTNLAKYFAWISGIVILAVIIGAFFIVGSPNTARLIQFDQQRVSDLQNIQSNIINYWQIPPDYQTDAQ